MAGQELFGAIRRRSDSSSGDEYVPQFIQFVDGRDPQIHEVWTFGGGRRHA